MATTREEIGLLVVHGIGEQKQLEHLRETANEIASYVESTPDLLRLSVSDLSATAGMIIIDAEFVDSHARRHVRLNCREVWWADLGASGGLGAQVAFWFWGLGQWAAEIHFKGRKLSNTSELMSLPHFAGDRADKPPGRRHRALSRIDLFFAGVLALLTLVTWSLVKRIGSFVAGRIPDTSLIFLFLGDVKAYQQPGGPGRGATEDPNMPRRATIRRRMVTEMTRMAAQRYDRWYILAHSLGSVLAFNGLQETELALPNYLEQAEWSALPDWLTTTTPYLPPGAKASVSNMMPRRPPWLNDNDGISREAMFDRFSGIVTYGSPLDKFAALWPRIVCLNKQKAVFHDRCEWLNLYDPTDPVGASLDGFGSRQHSDGSKISLVPRNFGCRSSKLFLLSHIRYLNPRMRRKHPMAQALVDAMLRDEQLAAPARKAANSRPRNAQRLALAIIQVVGLFALLTMGATGVLLFAKLVIFGKHVGFPTCVDGWQTVACAKTAATVSLILFGAANALVLLAGVLRFLVYDWRLKGK